MEEGQRKKKDTRERSKEGRGGEVTGREGRDGRSKSGQGVEG